MYKTAIILSLTISALAFSQVRIGSTNSVGNVTNTSVLLEFGTDNNKGIILPYVETVPTGVNTTKGGTIIFDVSANTEYKIKVKNENAGWKDLSVQSGYSSAVEAVVKPPQASPLADQSGSKVVIGDETTTTDGVLVLDSPTKAMVLPVVSNFTSIPNPSPGMMAFLQHPTDSTKHRLIVFNGQKWAFWKP
ncbi:hypothetical protein [Chryseobacterium sp. Leaf394]|uniref:hypothetical protein n=1 Tax=Chryseobacterium sp. Leaf394 TaxID=1736361 RepID=UPI0006FFB669|nr:hypothetical protein [Chryseobacterium sp. Leaf394]KQS89248.1 hypothetical protein ASG21_15805 [Chryseobacterium sp. Leaf394]